jgi:hypothetical protein
LARFASVALSVISDDTPLTKSVIRPPPPSLNSQHAVTLLPTGFVRSITAIPFGGFVRPPAGSRGFIM